MNAIRDRLKALRRAWTAFCATYHTALMSEKRRRQYAGHSHPF